MNTQGVSVPLSANVEKALADLRRVIELAREAKAATDGLPSPTGQGSPSSHPLTSQRMPRAQIPGGKAADMARPRMAPTTSAAESPALRAAAERGTPNLSPSVPRAATNMAANQAHMLAPSSGISRGAAQMATQAAMQNQGTRLAEQIMHGPRMTNGGPALGPVGLKNLANGSAMGQMMRALGPGAGYAAAAYVGLKTMQSASVGLADAIDEAARTGRDVNSVLAEKIYAGGVEWSREQAGGPLRAAAEVVKAVYDVFGGLGEAAKDRGLWGYVTRAFIPLSGALAMLGDPRDRAEAVKEGIDDYVDFAMGQHTGGLTRRQQRKRAADDAYEKAMAAVAARAAEMAAKDSERVADQLVGLGFPGTFDQVKNNPHVRAAVEELSNTAKAEAEQRLEREHSRIVNAKME